MPLFTPSHLARSCTSSPTHCVLVKLSAPVGRDVVRMGHKNAPVHRGRPPGILDIDGSSEGIERKSFGACVSISKQQKTIAGFTNKFRISRRVPQANGTRDGDGPMTRLRLWVGLWVGVSGQNLRNLQITNGGRYRIRTYDFHRVNLSRSSSLTT